MQKLLRVLQFFRITDENNNLSLTNIAIVVGLASLICRPELELQDAIIVVATLFGYYFKRFSLPTTASSDQEIEALKTAVASLETKITAIHMGKSLRGDR